MRKAVSTTADSCTVLFRAGSTDNGVFAARIMWGTMSHLVERLSGDPAGEDEPM
jgi:LPS sulfotransferase NodH